MPSARSHPVHGLLLLGVLGLAAAPVLAESWAETLARYEQDMRYTSLYLRSQGWRRLAASRDPRALGLLAERYEDPGQPGGPIRHLVADFAGRYLHGAEHVEGWRAWIEDEDDAEDAWLWFQGLGILARHETPDAVLGRGLATEDAYLEAAAIEALAWRNVQGALGVTAPLLAAEPPRRDAHRLLRLTSLASLAVSFKAQRATPPMQSLLLHLVDAMDDEDTPDWARLTLARQLAAALDLETPTLRTVYLRDAIAGAAASATDADRYGRPTFMGIEASGRRICYLIDLSDSMLRPLSDKERDDLRRGPVTPRPGDEAPADRPEDELPWDEIHTRFDAAREFLKLSLRGLEKDRHFVIITFGTEARLLDGMRGLVPARRGAIRRAIAELDRIEPRSPTNDRPLGRLEGDTNIHGALRRAFRVDRRGIDERVPAYVEPDLLEDGCDTIFLLTDGLPTADDWPGVDSVERTDRWRDPETGEVHGTGGRRYMGSTRFRGPYGRQGPELPQDVRRLNLFRKVEIHTVGLGEANTGLLRQLAAIGRGHARFLGR